ALTVLAIDALGYPVSGAAITFDASASGAGVSPAHATTDVAGKATTTMILGPIPGVQQFSATAAQLTVTVKASASAAQGSTPAKPAKLQYVSGNPQSDSACMNLSPFIVRAVDAFGTGVGG